MLEEHVLKLELSKKLYELGIVKDAEFWWMEEMKCLGTDNGYTGKYYIWHDKQFDYSVCPAPLLSELLELLPKKYFELVYVPQAHEDERWLFDIREESFAFGTLMEAIADGLIWLKENGHLEQ